MIWIGVILIGLILLTIIFGLVLSGPGHDGERSDHFDGTRFKNPNNLEAQNFIGVLKYGLKRNPEKWIKNYETEVRTDPIPIPTDNSVQVSFVNHSTFLIQLGGYNILTDPIWSKRCSPFQFMGPKRQRPPGLPFEMLPKIDICQHYKGTQ